MDYSPTKSIEGMNKEIKNMRKFKILLNQINPMKKVPIRLAQIILRNSLGVQQQPQLFSTLGPFSSKASAISRSISEINSGGHWSSLA